MIINLNMINKVKFNKKVKVYTILIITKINININLLNLLVLLILLLILWDLVNNINIVIIREIKLLI